MPDSELERLREEVAQLKTELAKAKELAKSNKKAAPKGRNWDHGRHR